jgi:CRISPR/Cas system-associated endonuclease Cas3-HD
VRIPTDEELARGMSLADASDHIRDIERLIDERHALRVEIERMRSVYETAKAMRLRGGYYNDVRDRLFAAVDAALTSEAKAKLK